MSLLSYNELCELIEQGVIDAPLENVNSSSIDLTFDDKILVRTVCDDYEPGWIEVNLQQGPYILVPGEFILASSKEYFNLPLDVSAEYKLKSSQARQGINHFLAGWADAGWHGKLTLEIINHDLAPVFIEAGKKAGQMIFHRHAPVPFKKAMRLAANTTGNISAGQQGDQMKPYLTGADIRRAYGLNKDIFSQIKPKLRRLRTQGNRVRYCPESVRQVLGVA